MIQLFRFGKPFQTDAVVDRIPVRPREELPYFAVEEDGCAFSLTLKKETVIFGLGENVRGINKRGWLYTSNCLDVPLHTEGESSLYAAHNFLLLADDRMFGVFFDYPGKLVFDLGYTRSSLLRVSAADANLDLYLIDGESPNDIVRQFRHMIGRSYMAPKWAFGYGQSRYSYFTADEVREVVKRHRQNHIPLDSVYLDIDYMDHYKDFTVNQESFPDFPDFVEEMRRQNIHLVPIVDAGVKIEKGYDVYEEGVKNGYFCRNADGTPFVGAVWPGKVHFPDVLNPKAREWFGSKYQFLLRQGIDGFWNDMNEPSIFYSEEGLKEAFAELQKLESGGNPDIDKVGRLKAAVAGLANSPKDYAGFYHDCGGRMVRHDKVHNLYGYHITRACGEAMEKLAPERRILLFSRSSYIGMHRYGGVWTGDNHSWWSHLLLEIQMMPSLNMCGFLYAGADIGGFGDNVTADLLLRWLEFGVFTPLMRNHSALGTRRQEVYQFEEELPALRNIIGIRYGLLPYLYSEYMKAALHDDMYFKPLAFVYPDDPAALRVEDQLMLGDELMLAPVHTQNAAGRVVYLPEPMKLVRMRSLKDFSTEDLEKGYHEVAVALEELVFFIRPDRLIPLSTGGESVPEVDFENLILLGNIRTEASYLYYDDDGSEKDYDNPAHYTTITVDRRNRIASHGGKALRLTALS